MMKSIHKSVANFVRDEEAATASEYAIIAAVMGVALYTLFNGVIKNGLTTAGGAVASRLNHSAGQ